MFFEIHPKIVKYFADTRIFFSVSDAIIDSCTLLLVFYFCAYIVPHFSYIWCTIRRFNSVLENNLYFEFDSETPYVVVTFHFILFLCI